MRCCGNVVNHGHLGCTRPNGFFAWHGSRDGAAVQLKVGDSTRVVKGPVSLDSLTLPLVQGSGIARFRGKAGWIEMEVAGCTHRASPQPILSQPILSCKLRSNSAARLSGGGDGSCCRVSVAACGIVDVDAKMRDSRGWTCPRMEPVSLSVLLRCAVGGHNWMQKPCQESCPM